MSQAALLLETPVRVVQARRKIMLTLIEMHSRFGENLLGISVESFSQYIVRRVKAWRGVIKASGGVVKRRRGCTRCQAWP